MIQKEISDRIASLKGDLAFVEFGMLIQVQTIQENDLTLEESSPYLKKIKELTQEGLEIKSLIARLEKLSEVRKIIDKNKV